MLDLRRLRVFREVAARRSFSGAALALDYTQSSVSQQVTALERELGVTLLDRAQRPVRPTHAGEVVLRRAEELLGQAGAIVEELAALTGGQTGTLRAGGFSTAWKTFLPEAVAAFSRAHPRVQLELDQLEPDAALRAVRAGDLDLAVVYRFPEPTERGQDDGLEWTHLLDDPYALVLPTGHPLARRRRVGLADLAEEHWVSPPASVPYSRSLRELCQREGGFTPTVTYETRDISMAQPLVAAGLAVGLLPALSLAQRHPGVTVRSLPSAPLARSVSIVRLAGRRTPAAAPMIAELRSAAARVDILPAAATAGGRPPAP
jgi:DNA-binding transcriptional LysR family regulator